jgi:hypothetical protein
MKYLKTGNLSDYGTSGRQFTVNPYGRITTTSTNSVKLPTGTTAERPQTEISANGMIRYNTSLNVLEAYMSGGWEIVKKPASVAIVKQTISGFNAETYYGPLTEVPASINNLIVLVDNVLQISTTNFVLEIDPAGTSPSRGDDPYPAGTYIRFTGDTPSTFEFVPTGIDITILYGFEL